RIYLPYVDTSDKALELADRLGEIAYEEGIRPIVFSTMPKAEIREILKRAPCFYVELFDTFLGPLARELGVPPSGKTGLAHGVSNGESYDARINSIHFAIANDDGMRLDNYEEADVILVGVSRSGKTPTCLYLAIHFGLRAANYPLTDEDFDLGGFPPALLPYRNKLFGLTIDPERLHRIREQRRPGSDYAALARCKREVLLAEELFHRLGMRVLNSTTQSIEEIASQIVNLL
ncbi:MAG TPA: pyruvate, phosphate dikinase/phosphoenolpyruvate synthase regulator, partial [Chromatiales bacterium]|nr:pyruvate, phosphate dikinase/phosphoenolpyruvate synthase regulator [Chromatiales bacterium]